MELPIGDVATIAGIATSTLRYYDRIGLVEPDHRVSGQRRYGPESVRRLVFVRMLQDAGLSLDEIRGMLDAPDNAAWRSIATERLERLDEEIARLSHARELLSAALLCRYDHPLEQCRHMNAEIDRRLEDAGLEAGPTAVDG